MKILLLLLILTTAAWSQDKNSDADLVQGLVEEEVNLDLDKAITHYQAILKRFEEQQKQAATALFRLAECYRKQGDDTQAMKHYRDVLVKFPAASALVTQCEQRLKSMGEIVPVPEANEAEMSEAETAEMKNARRMLEESPDLLDSLGEDGKTPLHRAVESNYLEVARFLLEQQTDPNRLCNVNDRPELPDQEMPLHAAVRLGHLSMTTLLLDHGAEIHGRSSMGTRPLHYAVYFDRLAIAELLCARGANAERIDGSVIKSNRDGLVLHKEHYVSGHVLKIDAFQLALLMNRPSDWLELLLKHGGNVNKAYVGTLFPIHVAVKNGWLDQVDYLLRHHADVDQADSIGLRPIHQVTNVAMLAQLQEREFDIHARDQEGNTALHHAARIGDVDLCQNLIEVGIDPNAANAEKLTALCVAIDAGQVDVVKYLVTEQKIDVNVRSNSHDASEITPLMRASGNDAIAQILLIADSDVNAKDNRGWTALHYAVSKRNLAVLTKLVAREADVFAKDLEGKCAVDVTSSSPCINYLSKQMQFRMERERDNAVWYEALGLRGYRPAIWKSPRIGAPLMLSDVRVGSVGSSHHFIYRTSVDSEIEWGRKIHWESSGPLGEPMRFLESTRKRVRVKHGDTEKEFSVVSSLVDPGIYVPGDTAVVASRLSEFLERAFVNSPTRDLSQITLTRKPEEGVEPVTFTFNAETAVADDDIWLREGDLIEIPDKEANLAAIHVTREADLFAVQIWDQDREHLRRLPEGEPGTHIAPTVADVIVAAFQRSEFSLPDSDWTKVQIVRGDSRMDVNLEAWLADEKTHGHPLQWGERIEIPAIESDKDLELTEITFPEPMRQALDKHLARTIRVNQREVRLAPAFYQFTKDNGAWIRKKLSAVSKDTVVESFWLPDLLDQLGFVPQGFDLANVTLNNEEQVDGQAQLWLLDGDRLVISARPLP